MDEYAKKHIKYISLFIIIFLLLTVIGLNINAWLTIIVLGFLIIVFLIIFIACIITRKVIINKQIYSDIL